MRIIAVLGEREDFSFLGMLKRFLEGNGIKTECIWAGAEREYVKETIFSKKPDVLIIFSEESFKFFFRKMYLYADIFIPLKKSACWDMPMKERSFVIVSSDDKKIFPFFLRKGTALITCGINSKASITVSSIDKDGEMIQCCIQRDIRCLTGEIFESQEFPLEKGRQETADRVLIAVGVLIVMGEIPLNITSKN